MSRAESPRINVRNLAAIAAAAGALAGPSIAEAKPAQIKVENPPTRAEIQARNNHIVEITAAEMGKFGAAITGLWNNQPAGQSSGDPNRQFKYVPPTTKEGASIKYTLTTSDVPKPLGSLGIYTLKVKMRPGKALPETPEQFNPEDASMVSVEEEVGTPNPKAKNGLSHVTVLYAASVRRTPKRGHVPYSRLTGHYKVNKEDSPPTNSGGARVFHSDVAISAENTNEPGMGGVPTQPNEETDLIFKNFDQITQQAFADGAMDYAPTSDYGLGNSQRSGLGQR